MHSLNDSCCDALPVFDKWPQPVRVKYETDSIARGYRIAPRKESKKALCTRINLQHVPISDHDKHGSLPDYKRNFLLKTSIQQSSSPHASAAAAKPAFTAKMTKSDGCRVCGSD